MNGYRDFDRKQIHEGKDSTGLKAAAKAGNVGSILWVPVPRSKHRGVDTVPR